MTKRLNSYFTITVILICLLISCIQVNAESKQIPAAGGELTSGTYVLTENMTVTGQLTIAASENVTIDLNGYVLNLNGMNIKNAGQLTIEDSNASKSNSVSGYSYAGGVITGGRGCYPGSGVWDTRTGGAIFNEATGTVYQKAGTLAHNGKTTRGGAVTNYGTYIMSGNSMMSDNDGGHNGGAVENSGTFIMRDNATLSNNRVSEDVYGQAVINVGSFIMENGLITGHDGWAVLNEGSITMTGGAITGNTGNRKAGAGIILTRDTITLIVGGSAKITGNKDGNADCNVKFHYVKPVITIATGDDAPTSDMEIGVTILPAPGKEGLAVTGANQADYLNQVKSDSSAISFANESNNVIRAYPHAHSWTCSGTDNVLKAYCTNTTGAEYCDYQGSGNAVKLTLSAENKTYTGTAITPAAFADETEKANWEAALGELPSIKYFKSTAPGMTNAVSEDIIPIDAGVYYAEAGAVIGGKYASAKVDFEIEPKAASIIPEDAAKHIGKDDPELTYITEGVVDGDELTGVEISREAGEEPGTYVISAEIDEAANPNYTINCGTAEFTIEDHDWSEYVDDNNADRNHDGTRTSTCRICGEKRTEIIPGTRIVDSGDESPIGAWVVLMISSAGMLLGVIRRRRVM